MYQTISGMLNSIAQAVSGIASSGLSGLNTFATNALQCLDNGPRILYEPLDFEYLNNIPTTTEAAVVRTILGNYPNNDLTFRKSRIISPTF